LPLAFIAQILKINPNLVKKTGHAFYSACSNTDINVIDYLLSHDVEEIDSNGYYVKNGGYMLSQCILSDNSSVFIYLIDKGIASLFHKMEDTVPPEFPIEATIKRRRPKIIKYLLEKEHISTEELFRGLIKTYGLNRYDRFYNNSDIEFIKGFFPSYNLVISNRTHILAINYLIICYNSLEEDIIEEQIRNLMKVNGNGLKLSLTGKAEIFREDFAKSGYQITNTPLRRMERW
jgi:hypothetical protein